MANTFSQIYLQFVFAVKHRQYLIPKEHKEELHKYFGGLVKNRNAKMLAINCMPDHTHLFVGVQTKCPDLRFCERAKGRKQ
jgi:REP element-mobilizing transposase RayT